MRLNSLTMTAFKNMLVAMLIITLTSISIYLLWGWITLEDIKKYCNSNKIDFEQTMYDLIPDLSGFEISVGEKGGSVNKQKLANEKPISRYIIPFTRIKTDKTSAYVTHGAILEPILAISENTRNATFCLSIGYLVGLFIVLLEYLKNKFPTTKRLILRPILGGISSTLLFIVIISGGALIWNEVSGINGLSIGLVATIGSLYCEKFSDLVTF